jgi:hypothetical protein
MPLLNDAFDAVSIMFAGESLNNTKLVEAGEKLYNKVLKGLQQALYHPKESRSLAVLGTVGLLMVFEVRLLTITIKSKVADHAPVAVTSVREGQCSSPTHACYTHITATSRPW